MNDKTKAAKRKREGAETPEVKVAEGEKIFILADGQKTGPFTQEQIAEMVSSHDLLVTDSVSLNGFEWFTLYQWKAFDRRAVHSEELPGPPQVKLFIASDKEASGTLANSNDEHIEKEAMAGLAYLGNVDSGKRAQHHDDKYTKETKPGEITELEPVTFEKKSTSKQTYIWGAVLSLALVGIMYLYFGPGKVNKLANKKTPVSKINKVVKAKAKPQIKKNGPKKPKASGLNAGSITTRRNSKPFAKSKAFKNRAPRKPASRAAKIDKPVVEDPDDYYYDDGSEPVELDPVRSKLAKETFDPDDDNLDDYLDEVDAEREPASEEEDPEKAFEALYE